MTDEMMSAESLLCKAERATEEAVAILRHVHATLELQQQLERNIRVSAKVRREIAVRLGAEFASA